MSSQWVFEKTMPKYRDFFHSIEESSTIEVRLFECVKYTMCIWVTWALGSSEVFKSFFSENRRSGRHADKLLKIRRITNTIDHLKRKRKQIVAFCVSVEFRQTFSKLSASVTTLFGVCPIAHKATFILLSFLTFDFFVVDVKMHLTRHPSTRTMCVEQQIKHQISTSAWNDEPYTVHGHVHSQISNWFTFNCWLQFFLSLPV